MAPKRTLHLDACQIEAYCMETMPETEVSALEEHLLTCEACRQWVAEGDQYVRSMRLAGAHLRAKEPAPRPRRAASSGMLVLVAAAVVVVGAGGILRLRQQDGGKRVSVELEATRSGFAIARVPAGRRMLLRPGIEGLPVFPDYHLEIVDRTGKRVWQANFTPPNGAEAPAEPLGVYYVRLYSLHGTLLREYALEIQNGT